MYVSGEAEELVVENNPAFAARGVMPRASHEADFFYRVMRSVEMAARQGLPIEPEVVVEQDATLRTPQVAELLSTEKFRIAAHDRGIDVSDKPGLSAQQLAALAVYTDMSRPLNHSQKLRAAGVTQTQWRGWLRQRVFSEELAFLSKENLRASIAVGEQRLAEHVDSGNMHAIEFVFAMEGRFRKDQQAVDVRKMLLEIYNILDEEGVPLVTLSRVADRIKALPGEPVVMEATVIESKPLEQGVV